MKSRHGDWTEVRSRRQRRSDRSHPEITTFFVYGFHDGINGSELKKVFQGFGQVVDVFVSRKKDANRRNFAFVRGNIVSTLPLPPPPPPPPPERVGKPYGGLSGGKSFAEVVGARRNNESHNTSYPTKTVHINPDASLKSWLSSTLLIGEAHSLNHISNLPAALSGNGVKYLGGLNLAIEMGSSTKAKDLMEDRDRWAECDDDDGESEGVSDTWMGDGEDDDMEKEDGEFCPDEEPKTSVNDEADNDNKKSEEIPAKDHIGDEGNPDPSGTGPQGGDGPLPTEVFLEKEDVNSKLSSNKTGSDPVQQIQTGTAQGEEELGGGDPVVDPIAALVPLGCFGPFPSNIISNGPSKSGVKRRRLSRSSPKSVSQDPPSNPFTFPSIPFDANSNQFDLNRNIQPQLSNDTGGDTLATSSTSNELEATAEVGAEIGFQIAPDNEVLESGEVWEWRHNIINPELLDELNRMRSIIGSFCSNGGRDRWKCGLANDGEFSVAAVRRCMDGANMSTSTLKEELECADHALVKCDLARKVKKGNNGLVRDWRSPGQLDIRAA
ncbi:hypothetical protein L2E82_08349 [Cichorium intybus]|uniref:Uncharacterized protein n=1 Tax=Cichorium intybus TaxID=13427 RepID=A0ACB9G5P7_CICIN|nr:hypothetical protein L2E82_08349 [Cichorium intybus]